MTPRRITIVILTVAAAIALLALLVHLSGASLDQLARILSALGPWQILGCLIGIAAPVLIASVKWRSVVERVMRVPTDLPGFTFFLHFSALSGVLGQVITPYAAGPMVRGMATRRVRGGSFVFGASTSMLEQFFDAWASLVFASAGVLLLLLGVSEQIALFGYVVVAVIGAVGVQIILILPSSEAVLRRLSTILPGQHERLEALMRLKVRSNVISSGFVNRLYWLSVLRFWIVGVAVIAVASSFSRDWTVLSLLHVYAAAQITRFAVFTPGNLGLAEWGWTTVLAFYGWSFQSAALFALAFRVVGITFTCIVYLFAAGFYLLPGWFSGYRKRYGQ